MPAVLPALALAALVGLGACASPDAPPPPGASRADSLAALAADPPFEGTWWRLASLGGSAPTEGVRPVLIFTETPAHRDTYDRPYPDSLADWRIVTGDLGVGHLHAPYRREGDALRFAETYDYTRSSTPAEQAQARRLADALAATRSVAQDGPRLAFLGAGADTLATFAADPPRPPGALDGTEWVLTYIGAASGEGPATSDIPGHPVPDSVRADLTFSSRRLGPGEGDGFDQYGGYSGCNWYGGGYRLASGDSTGHLRIETNGPPTATQRGCAPGAMGVEGAVLNALYRAAAVVVARDGAPTDHAHEATALALHDSTGALLLEFRRHVPPPVDLGALREGRWRFEATDSPFVQGAEGTTVAFADSTFTASNGCYRMSGTWRVDGDNLHVLTEPTDGPGCPPGEIRTVPVASGKLSVTADRLVLYDENGAATTFARSSR